MNKCIVIPDSFKGTLSSQEICNMAKNKINKFFPDCQVVTIPVADGGEGTVDCLLQAIKGEKVSVKIDGPYREQIDSFYGRFNDLAVIEMAAAAGLPMVEGRENPAVTTTFGVGQLIKHAVDNGAKKVILGLGGSCTNDGGCGCAAALGTRFTDCENQEFVPVGSTLDKICHIDTSVTESLLEGCEVIAICDVDNPMHGTNGAAHVFSRQKGADAEMVQELDTQLKALDKSMQDCLKIDISHIGGTGAAGALGAGVLAFMNGKLQSGIETILDIVSFDEQLKNVDAVFTGEGKIDSQSLRGKVVIGVANRAKKQHVPVYAIVGDVADDAYMAYDMGVTAIFSINRQAIPFSIAKTRSKQDFESTFEDIMRFMYSIEGRM